MTHSQTWKKLERVAAKKLGGQRQFNTGAHNKEDVTHPRMVIECKVRASLAIKKWWEQAKKHCTGENKDKVPVLITKEKGMRGEFIIMKLDDYLSLHGGDDDK